MSNVLAIVQARIGSTRLPGKMMIDLHGYPIVEWVYRRICMAQKIDDVIFAIPDTHDNDVLEVFLKSLGADVYRGSESNVVDRFYKVTMVRKPQLVVRVCADNPLISPCIVDSLVDFFARNQCDYAYNHIPKAGGWPDGLGAEITSSSLIEKIHLESTSGAQREHLYNYIWDNQSEFSIKCVPVPKVCAYPNLKFDIDTLSDYIVLQSLPLKIDFTAEQIINCALNKNYKSI